MRGAIPPLLSTSSWRGGWLSTGTTLFYPTLLTGDCFQAKTVQLLHLPTYNTV